MNLTSQRALQFFKATLFFVFSRLGETLVHLVKKPFKKKANTCPRNKYHLLVLLPWEEGRPKVGSLVFKKTRKIFL
jgi:hypothetical protein